MKTGSSGNKAALRLKTFGKKFLLPLWEALYYLSLALMAPVNIGILCFFKNTVYPGSVLHISGMIHVPYYMVKALRKYGVKADYMAIGESRVWDKSDFKVVFSRLPFVRVIQEMYWFWRVAARYEIVHSHFMLGISYSGWEFPLLKKMERKIVIHYRGCDIRERKKNMEAYPDVNVCQECDYLHKHAGRYTCELEYIKSRRRLVSKYGDLFLVTTPDLKNFAPAEAEYLPFFTPEVDEETQPPGHENNGRKKGIKIVHATNHPGIEGTDEIRRAIEGLVKKGYDIQLVFLKGVPHETVLKEYRDADLSIGKMKMGYYANSQIESMLLGVPAVTFIRKEFMTPELENSGFIISSLARLERDLEYYLANPGELDKKKSLARESIVRLHDNEVLSRRLAGHYNRLFEAGKRREQGIKTQA